MTDAPDGTMKQGHRVAMSSLVIGTEKRMALSAASALFSSLGETLICVDADYRISYAPETLRDLVGRPAAEVFGPETDSLLRRGEFAQLHTQIRNASAQTVLLTLAPFTERQRFGDVAYVITLKADEKTSNEAEKIRLALETHRWRRDAAARSLGISRATLWRKMRSFGLL